MTCKVSWNGGDDAAGKELLQRIVIYHRESSHSKGYVCITRIKDGKTEQSAHRKKRGGSCGVPNERHKQKAT